MRRLGRVDRTSMAILLAIVLGVCWMVDRGRTMGEDVYGAVDRNLDRFDEAYRKIVYSYYQEIDPGEILIAGIDGMLAELDPYSQFIHQLQYEQLKIDTTGKFGGLGISIGMKDGLPTVIWTMEGTPADSVGLLAGDRIVEIEGERTSEKTLDQVVSAIRGRPGTILNIKVEREGEREELPFRVVRQVITVKSVTFADEIEPGIGYIRMFRTRFSENTGADLEAGLRKLGRKGVNGVILDLRGNPGGLLPQAREVSDKFLEKGQLIVYTEGRADGQSRQYHAKEPPVLAPEVRVVVLVDRGSASASEIVAGAIQDWDRGLILGTGTYGKGSVQTVMNLDQKAAVKLTTALYYTPSGRCIHKDRGDRAGGYPSSIAIAGRILPLDRVLDEVAQAQGTLAAEEALMDAFALRPLEVRALLRMTLEELVAAGLREAEQDSVREKRTTPAGRVVYGGGGITPDIKVESEIPPFARALERRRLPFSFSVHYAAVHSDIETGFEADDAVIREFREYISGGQKRFEYTVPGEMELEQLEEAIEEAQYAEGLLGEMNLEAVRETFEKQEERDFQESLEYIRGAIEREIASRMWGTEARIRAGFKVDRQLKRAIALLQSPEDYARAIRGIASEERSDAGVDIEMGAP